MRITQVATLVALGAPLTRAAGASTGAVDRWNIERRLIVDANSTVPATCHEIARAVSNASQVFFPLAPEYFEDTQVRASLLTPSCLKSE